VGGGAGGAGAGGPMVNYELLYPLAES
jgi:hypothetical protein